MEPEAPLNADKKRVKKAKFKWHEKGGKAAKQLSKENLKKKEKNEQRAGGAKAVFKDDLILI
jgi:hypothetical protein